MPPAAEPSVPAGTIVYREFEIAYRGGRRVNVAFTLARRDHECAATTIARGVGAVACGLVSAVDSTEVVSYPMYWFYDGKSACVVPADKIRVPDMEIRATVGSLLELFFADIASETPELAFLVPTLSDVRTHRH